MKVNQLKVTYNLRVKSARLNKGFLTEVTGFDKTKISKGIDSGNVKKIVPH